MVSFTGRIIIVEINIIIYIYIIIIYIYNNNLNIISIITFNKVYMDIHIFILCYNEEVLLPHTINHYKKYIPNCKITIYDNESTDNSVEIAKNLGCAVISWNSDNMINDYKYKDIKNNCWKHLKKGWMIVCDMDEWLCVKEKDLIKEKENGTTILQVKALNMIGESKKYDLSDIGDLHTITKCHYNNWMNKKCCFLRDNIQEMNFGLGAHNCNPKGKIKYSKRVYINKHLDHLGEKFFVNRRIIRHNRSHVMRKNGCCIHYAVGDEEKLAKEYHSSLRSAKDIKILIPWASY